MITRRPKSFSWYYFWFLITSGAFSVYWLFSMMEDINALAETRIFRSAITVFPLAMGMLGVTIGIGLGMTFEQEFLSNPLYTISYAAICIFTEAALFLTTVWVYRGLLRLDGRSFGLADIGFALGNILLMGFLFPYIQLRINDRLNQQTALAR